MYRNRLTGDGVVPRPHAPRMPLSPSVLRARAREGRIPPPAAGEREDRVGTEVTTAGRDRGDRRDQPTAESSRPRRAAPAARTPSRRASAQTSCCPAAPSHSDPPRERRRRPPASYKFPLIGSIGSTTIRRSRQRNCLRVDFEVRLAVLEIGGGLAPVSWTVEGLGSGYLV
jgi:hypothetical protein